MMTKAELMVSKYPVREIQTLFFVPNTSKDISNCIAVTTSRYNIVTNRCDIIMNSYFKVINAIYKKIDSVYIV